MLLCIRKGTPNKAHCMLNIDTTYYAFVLSKYFGWETLRLLRESS